ncbi:MAG: hypothetical protein UW86_C0011G0003 [Microgenomates group bacterium GW2011_GWA1_Microgenomates_45_10]|nr:MAG: hypothetical protein UW86_C0011G0003 [Microgenomates group bacterium GW2011_GWA1_Microgenomates_45_10]KKT97414.1 MAG: hypothetical protein UX00_C0011G0026 [Microgenomates group bacterium GW2011_GWB1_45_17]KKU28886.1 MAG: hypothetical protein UX42_C0006G0038 [Microgenomates group bacterium GW2011_GWC1_46_20]
MQNARRRAEKILRKYKISTAPINIMKIVKGERLCLVPWSFKGRLEEVYLGDCIGVKKDLPCCQRRELVAHALGHHFLGDGNHCYYATHNHLVLKKQERGAQYFAGFLLIPRALLRKNKKMRPAELADYFCVTEKFVKKRLRLEKALKS